MTFSPFSADNEATGWRRRDLLSGGALALGWSTLLGLPRHANGQAHAQAGRTPAGDGRLVVVFLRGACDALSAWVPLDDPHYAAMRPGIAIPPPDGTADTALRLDGRFAMHPALAPLWPVWQQGVLSFVPCAGLPTPVRSHFEAQHGWETGQPGKTSEADGWLNLLAHHLGGPGQVAALGVGEVNPELLRGPAAVRRVPRGRAATRSGALANGRTRQALLDLYAGSPELGPMFQRGVGNRLETARTLEQAQAMAGTDAQAASNGAGNAAALLLDTHHLLTLLAQDPALRVGFLSVGGWDTHVNQGSATGALANQLAALARSLVMLHTALTRPDDVVVVVSEFGRTAAENGSRGTDHGHGGAIWLMGPRVAGGRWHGRWEGLAPDMLNEGRDVPVFHDYRAVLGQVLQRTQGLGDADLARLFVGTPYVGAALYAGDQRLLAGMIRG